MITGSLNTLQRTPLPAPLDRIMVEVVQSVEQWLQAPLGKQEIDGLTLFCLVSEELTEPAVRADQLSGAATGRFRHLLAGRTAPPALYL